MQPENADPYILWMEFGKSNVHKATSFLKTLGPIAVTG